MKSWKTDPFHGLAVNFFGGRVEVVDFIQTRRGPVLLLHVNDRREWMTLSEWRRWFNPCKGDPPRKPAGDDSDDDSGGG